MNRRDILKNSALGAIGLSMSARSFALSEIADPYLRFVHPELRAAAAQMLQMFAKDAALSFESLPAKRDGMLRYMRPVRSDVPVEKRMISGAAGQPDILIIIINAKTDGSRPAIVNTHGGGFVLGTAMSDVADLQDICEQLDVVAISVEYRLAPETTYAGSVEDNYAALKWLHKNAASIGADPSRIAVMGGSAGGGHAALLAITARDRGEVPLVFQCLTYPMLDDRTGTSRAVPDHVGKIIWNAQSNRFGWASFLGREPGGSDVPVAGVPARTADVSRLPPAFIGVGSIDLFHDEDVDYAQRLNAAGVATELIVVPGAFHGFDGIGQIAGGINISQWFINARTEALRLGLGLGAEPSKG